MKRFTVSLTLFCIFLATTGCITELNVKKVSTMKPKRNGFYYSLPIPFLVVKPNGDGTMEVEVEYLPDPDHQYAVSGWSFLGAHDLTVDVDDQGILKKIVWNADDSAVAGGLVEGAGTIGAAKIAADGEEKKAQETQIEMQAKELADKLGDAKEAEAQTQTEYGVALAQLKELEDLDRKKQRRVSTDELKKARLEVVASEVRRDAARRNAENVAASQTFSEPSSSSAKKEKELLVLEEKRQNLEKKLQDLTKKPLAPGETQETRNQSTDDAEANLQKVSTQIQMAKVQLHEEITNQIGKFLDAWGWVWYRIDEENKMGKPDPWLELVTIKSPGSAPSGQLLAPSAGPPKKGSKPSDLILQITSPSPGVIELEKGALAKITIETNQDLVSAPDKTKGDAKLIKKIDGSDVTSHYLQRTTLDLINKRKLTVDIAPSAPTGIYILTMVLAIDSSENPQKVAKKIEIELLRK